MSEQKYLDFKGEIDLHHGIVMEGRRVRAAHRERNESGTTWPMKEGKTSTQIVREIAGHPLIAWAHVDEDGAIWDDLHVAVERGYGGIHSKPYILKAALIAYFNQVDIDFEDFFEQEYEVYMLSKGHSPVIEVPFTESKGLTIQAAFDVLYGLHHHPKYLRALMRSSHITKHVAQAQRVVSDMCIEYMHALPKVIQDEMYSITANNWWDKKKGSVEQV